MWSLIKSLLGVGSGFLGSILRAGIISGSAIIASKGWFSPEAVQGVADWLILGGGVIISLALSWLDKKAEAEKLAEAKTE